MILNSLGLPVRAPFMDLLVRLPFVDQGLREILKVIGVCGTQSPQPPKSLKAA